MGSRLIAFECVDPDHQQVGDHPDKLTVHEGGWAYCPFDALAERHTWRQTGGVDLEQIQFHRSLANHAGAKTPA